MKFIKVKSNSARNQVVLINDLALHFNNEGIAEVPVHKKDIVERESHMRPGRYSFVEDKLPVVPEAPTESVTHTIDEYGEKMIEIEYSIGPDETEYLEPKKEIKRGKAKGK